MPYKKNKTRKVRRTLLLREGGRTTLVVRRNKKDVVLSLSKETLSYLKVKSGDKLLIHAGDGQLKITPFLTAEQEIEKYISQ